MTLHKRLKIQPRSSFLFRREGKSDTLPSSISKGEGGHRTLVTKSFFIGCGALAILFTLSFLIQDSSDKSAREFFAAARSRQSTIYDGEQDNMTGPIVKIPVEEVVDDAPAATEADASEQYLAKGEEIFLNASKSMSPVTDKVTKHTYQIMYGRFLLPYYAQNPTMKMLEIGLGCDMNYGPGASTALWKKLFPEADLWEAEFNADCVEKHRADKLKGFNVLIGDQGNETVLDSWVQESGGNFDVVIDDGGHRNCQIWHSFLKLWPTVKPGGLYFIEDLQVGKWPRYREFTTNTCDEDLIVMDKLKEYMDVMIHADQKKQFQKSDIEFIFCQHEACVVGKKR